MGSIRKKITMTPEASKKRRSWLKKIRIDMIEGKPLTTWMDQKGNLLNIKDMKDSHLQNTIYFLEEKPAQDELTIWRLKFLRKEKFLRKLN